MKIHCYCDNEISIDVPEYYTLDSELAEKIQKGDFLLVTCDKCGKLLKPEIEIDIRSGDGTTYHFIPENDRYSFFEKNDTFPDNVLCIVGYQELFELVSIKNAHLSSEVIELIKLQIIQKVPDPSSVIILFNSLSDNKLVFHLHGLKENEIGVMNIPFSLYEKMQNDLPVLSKSEPYKTIIQRPYISLRKHIEDEAEE